MPEHHLAAAIVISTFIRSMRVAGTNQDVSGEHRRVAVAARIQSD